MKTKKMIINYETIKGMEVEMPIGPIDPETVLEVWVRGFIKYMTQNAIISTECIFNSIGESSAKKALVAGLEQRIEDEKTRKLFIDHVMNETNWRYEVFKQRDGIEAAILDRFGKEQGRKMIEVFGIENFK